MSFFKSFQGERNLPVLVMVRGPSDREGFTNIEISTHKEGVFLKVTLFIPDETVWTVFEELSEESVINIAQLLIRGAIGDEEEE